MQNPPPTDQGYGYGNQYGTPPNAPLTTPPGGGPNDKTALGMDANLASAIGYPIGIIALIMVIIEKQNRFARFHALQSLLLSVASVILLIVLSIFVAILSAVSSYLGLLGLFIPLLWLVYFAALIFCAYKAYQGEMFKLPVIGDMAANFANK
ncbi:MAG TPA: DUF4870 domain-containing protein [Pyrinomonadaceae bacterium]|jgi:uncharacterized membrane protein|nr:DUF4870 domain-containing protein [Pyrinomonadaceae bacterium]